MLRRVFWLVMAFPAAVILVTLALANRHPVRLVLDPFLPETPVLSLVMPFYAYLFIVLVAGVVLGGVATWASQSKWRRAARSRTLEAMRWRAEVDRLSRERDRNAAEGKELALTNR